jgi:hypothetical protein
MNAREEQRMIVILRSPGCALEAIMFVCPNSYSYLESSLVRSGLHEPNGTSSAHISRSGRVGEYRHNGL